MANEPSQTPSEPQANARQPQPRSREPIQRNANLTVSYACVVEIADSRNGNVLWPITQAVLRGKWARANIPAQSYPERLQEMPDLPGMHIAIDTNRRKGSVFDLLSRSTHKDLLKKANRQHLAIWGVECEPERDITLATMTDNQMKSWLYWIRRMLDAKQCVCVEGTVPSMAQIEAMPGTFMTNVFDASVHVKKETEKSVYPYVAPVIQDYQKRQADLVEDDGQSYFQKSGVGESDDDDLLDD